MQKQYVKCTQEKHNMTSLKEKVQLNINNPEFDQSAQAWKKKKQPSKENETHATLYWLLSNFYFSSEVALNLCSRRELNKMK